MHVPGSDETMRNLVSDDHMGSFCTENVCIAPSDESTNDCRYYGRRSACCG